MSTKEWTLPPLIWRHPNPSFTRIEVFRRWINHKHGLDLKDYYGLHGYSITNWTFWKDLWEFLGIVCSEAPQKVIEDGPQQDSPKWFPGARLNYAENILVRSDDSIACTVVREHGYRRHYTYRELRQSVQRMASAMRANGVQTGDRVAAIVTNSIDPLVIMLAAASLGALYSSTATDMGTAGILDRYRQIRPKLIFSDTEVMYAGKRIGLEDKIVSVAKELSSFDLAAIVILPSTITGEEIPISTSVKTFTLEAFLKTGKEGPLNFLQLPFHHPLFILYSSGTSGPPKCIVHTAGGVLLQSMKDYAFHMNAFRDDTHFQFTTCAWMMWNSMIANLALGARLILYDGSPFHPGIGRLLEIVDTERVTHFGTSPRFLSELQGKGVRFSDFGSFSSLRLMFVTGAILTIPAYIWTSSQVPKGTHVLAGSGGTDICSSFVTGCTSLDAHAGEMQVKSLGMKVEVFDPEGRNVESSGEPGELVCTRAHPSIPLGFWGDHKRAKFHEVYFSKYPGVWTQGDFMVVNPLSKGIYLLGRSDAVLNPSGVRFGSGEIYTVMEKFSRMVDDCLCVGQRRPQDKDERVLLFVKMRPGHTFDEGFKSNVRTAIREALSTRHVPSYIFQVDEIPYTVNNKKIEIAVKQIVSGLKIKPSGTIANPASLELYYKYVDLEKIVAGQRAKL